MRCLGLTTADRSVDHVYKFLRQSQEPARNRTLRFEPLEARTMTAVGVVPSVETVAASGGEDDAAIWIHPTNTAQSRIIGAVKTGSNALRVFDLNGQQVQSVAVSNINNIDLRYNFPLAGQPDRAAGRQQPVEQQHRAVQDRFANRDA